MNKKKHSNPVPVLALAVTALACAPAAKPITDQPAAETQQSTDDLGPAAKQWASIEQPAEVIKFFDGTFGTLAVTMGDTGETFTVKHTGEHFEFINGHVEDPDFTVTLLDKDVRHMQEYSQDGSLDMSEVGLIMKILFTPFARQVLAHPATKDPELRAKSGVADDNVIHAFLISSEGETLASHTLVYSAESEAWEVTEGISGEPDRIFKMSPEQAVEYHRRAFGAIQKSSSSGWHDFAEWYAGWRKEVSEAPSAS